MPPLPKELDEKISRRFEELIEGFGRLIDPLRKAAHEREYGLASSPSFRHLLTDINTRNSANEISYHQLVTSTDILVETILGETKARQFLQGLKDADAAATCERYLGKLQSLKTNYEDGLLDISRTIETDMASELIDLAEQAQGRNLQQKFARLLKAFTAGVILEDALRRLCQRHNPPLETEVDGEPMTLDPLITQLQKANVFNKAKADQLRSWAKIRNFAAHANFTELERSNVDQMVLGVKEFLGELY